MSYNSENRLPKGTKLNTVREIIDLLGYKKVNDPFKVPDRTDSMMWFEKTNYKSWTGVELDIYKDQDSVIVTTRSRSGRSYWDLTHQNRTVRLIKNLFGGYFRTDEGRNRYWHPEGNPPTFVSSGCYLARWHFHNALMFPMLLKQGKLEFHNFSSVPTGIEYIDWINPLFFANKLLVPYIVAIWEEYFRSIYVVLLRYSGNRVSVLKRNKLSQHQLESVAAGRQDVEQAVAESLSFQRPSSISSNFESMEPNLDIKSSFLKPYRRRRKHLFDSIEETVELRNQFVHTGEIEAHLTDKDIDKIINDIEVVVDRVYVQMGSYFGFSPIRDY